MGYEDGRSPQGAARPSKPHSLHLEGRRTLSVSGVEDVESFDEREIVMRCGGGLLVVGGEELSVGKLSVESGDVTVSGHISSLIYEEAAPKRGGFWKSMLRG